MFSCNSLNLLTFTYYLKVVLAASMTIIPFVLSERIIIKLIKYKEINKKIDKNILKQQSTSLFYIFTIFILSFSLHNGLNNDNNVCYKYATTNILNEYKDTYHALKNEDLSDEVKYKYLENVLIESYNNSLNINNLKNNINNDKNNKKMVLEVIKFNIIDELSLNETNDKKLNNVYVKNGVFYYPKYIYGNKSTYSGMNCPNNPLKEGYNNQYGYNNHFYKRLTAFIEAASLNGYKITFSTQGCRTYNTQIYYYNTMAKGRASYPGYSLHGFGIASDLEFYQSDGSVCPYGRTETSCPSMGWAHKNASKFGLTFPLLNASYKEDWHIEPINKTKY